MKKVLLALIAVPAATFAVEASAQTYANTNANVTVQNQIVRLQAVLDAGTRSGAIDNQEARRLRQEIRQLNRLERQYARGGLTTNEWNVLQQRVGSIGQQLQVAGGGYAYGNSGYDNGQAYGNNGYSYDQYGRRVQTNGYTYDQYGRRVPTTGYTTDAYGRPIQNGYYGQGGPYEAAPRSGGVGNVLGGVLGSVGGAGGLLGSVLGSGSGVGGVLGSILGNGGLRVGDVISSVLGGALGGVPSGYQTRYRDRNDVYFRSDGERVYEIDARTNAVVGVHPIRR